MIVEGFAGDVKLQNLTTSTQRNLAHVWKYVYWFGKFGSRDSCKK